MADTALERYKKDTQQEVEQTKPGEIRTLNEFQAAFLKSLENVGEPKKPVEYLTPF
jgi:phage-related protein